MQSLTIIIACVYGFIFKLDQQLELYMKKLTGSKLRKEYDKAIYWYSAYLTYMQSILREMPGWMYHKLESRLLGERSTTSDMQMIPL